MDERVIREWLRGVRSGSLSRRELVGTLLGLRLPPLLIAELLRRGWTDPDVKKMAGLNCLRVMRAVEGVAARMRAGR